MTKYPCNGSRFNWKIVPNNSRFDPFNRGVVNLNPDFFAGKERSFYLVVIRQAWTSFWPHYVSAYWPTTTMLLHALVQIEVDFLVL